MKKFSYLAAVAVLTLATLVGCGKAEGEAEVSTDVVTDGAKDEKAEPTETVEPTEIVEAPATDLTITHSLGTVTVPVNPSKAVIFDYGILDTAKELGVDVELSVVTSGLPEYLSEYSTNANAGSLKSPDLEAIFDFEPEVIFISGRQQDYYEQLTEIAPTVYVELGSDTYMEDFKKNVGIVADVFGKQDVAAEKLAEIDAMAAEAIANIETKEDKGLILLTNDGSISAYGKGSRFGFIHDYLGVKAADEAIESSTHGQEANYEYISKVNPDIIFVVDRTEATGATATVNNVLDNELVKETNAAKNGKIVNLDATVWYKAGGGISSVKQMVTEIADAMK